MPADAAARPSPDALLSLAKREARGHLKIFLGAAPGVGKTYAMLSAARAAKAEGREVVIGLVETHDRPETEALLHGLEILPRKSVPYRNQLVREFDLDAALARRPSLLLVDEYAHTNAPGSRHPKRWQDIDELLDAGVDIWTTLNVQHLESLNDVIQQITRVRVRETVPDIVFDRADEIVLVDLPSDELLKRLAEGKVYIQDTAARAINNFFKPQNLTALRELALRRAAKRIDADLVEHMQAHAIEGPWAAGERILACVGPDSVSPTIVRTAKRLADLMGAPWLAVTVERPARAISQATRSKLDEVLRLAGSLGADTRTLVGNDIPQELLRFARFENVTQIVIGRSRSSWLGELFRRSLPHELVRRVDDIAIHIVTDRRESSPSEESYRAGIHRRFHPAPYIWSTLAVAVAVVLGVGMSTLTPFPNVSMIFLMAVLIPAAAFGMWPAIYSSVLSFLAYNFFFIEPRLTFTVARPYELFALLVFLGVAVFTSALAGRIRDHAQVSAQRMRATRRLYEFTKKLSGLATLDAVAEAAASEINASLGRATMILLQEDGELVLRSAWPPEDALDTAAMSAARWALSKNEPAGAQTGTLPTVPWLFLPLKWSRGGGAILAIAHGHDLPPLDPEARALLDTLAEQTASALERVSLNIEMVSARSDAEAERVRNTLLASISHDFRTPLASILGSSTSLLEHGQQMQEADRKGLLKQIKDETEHLDEMVRNLLSITRIDAGALELRRDWIDLAEIIERVTSRARRRQASQPIEMKLEAGLPLVRADATLVEQAISNVVENAIVHTPADTRISIEAVARPQAIEVRVTDDGPGITSEILPHVFDKFFHGRKSGPTDREERTGLGLAIAKGIFEAHGGSVAANSPMTAGRGTQVVLTLPRTETAV
jgi:two-component system sensor histidine kinase KdpD